MSGRSRLTNLRQMDYVAHDLRIRSSIAPPLRPAPSPAEERSPGVGARRTLRGRTDPGRRGRHRPHPTGVSATDAEMSALSLHRSEFHGDWNHELRPR